MFRAYHPFDVPAEATTLTLSREESFHLVKVLRARANEEIVAFDGRGNYWCGKMLNADAKALEVEIYLRSRQEPPKCKLALAQALPKGALTDDIIRAAVEIGLAEFFPILSSRSEMRLDAARAAHKLERWQAIAIEACKQCGNFFVPKIHPVMSAKTFFDKMKSESSATLKLTASLEAGTRTCREIENTVRENPPEKILWLVGPEGDLSPEEYASALEFGFLPTRLGQFVLRVPTAALYCFSVADQMRGNFYTTE